MKTDNLILAIEKAIADLNKMFDKQEQNISRAASCTLYFYQNQITNALSSYDIYLSYLQFIKASFESIDTIDRPVELVNDYDNLRNRYVAVFTRLRKQYNSFKIY